MEERKDNRRGASDRRREELRRLLLELRPQPRPQRVPKTLGEAAGRGDSALVKTFLEDGASLSVGYREGWTPIERARKRGHEEVVALLLAHGAEDRRPREPGAVSRLIGRWIFGVREESAGQGGESSAWPVDDESAPMSNDDRQRAMDRAVHLIRSGVLGNDPAMFVVEHDPVLPFACEHGLGEIVRALLDIGVLPVCPPGMQDGGGPLTWAAAAGHDIVQLLLERGADVNVHDQKDRRHLPLGDAAERGDLELVRLLLDAGADPMASTDSGTALQLAAGPRANAVRALLESRARAAAGTPPPSALSFEEWRGQAPVDGWRAFHELWSPHDFQTILVRAPIEAAGQAYADLMEAVHLKRDLGRRILPGNPAGHFLLQMRGCPWTAILFDLGGAGVELEASRVSRGLSRALDAEVVSTSAYDGASAYQIYDRGKKDEGFDEAPGVEAIDGADDEKLEAAAIEAARRYHRCFEERGVRVPPVEEDRDGLRTRLVLYGVEAGDVQRVDFAACGA